MPATEELIDNPRDDLAAAFDAHEADDNAQEPVQNAPEPAVDGESAENIGSETQNARARDSQGRFVKSAAELADDAAQAAAAPAVTPAAAPQAPQAPAADEIRAPQSWTPAAREAWAQVPPAARQEIMRREQEVAHTLNETAAARNIANQFSETLQPYMQRIKATGVNPLQAIDNLMSTEVRLAHGTMQEKAHTIAQMIQAYGVDIGTLDSMLAGNAPPPDVAIQSQVQQMVAQQLAPFQQMMQVAAQRKAEADQQVMQGASSEIQTFAADPKNEFFEDVRGIMGDLLTVAKNNGVEMSLKRAYDQAIRLHPQTSGVIEQREAARQAQQTNGLAQRAKRAAISVSGSPVLGNPDVEEPTDLRSFIGAAIDASQRV